MRNALTVDVEDYFQVSAFAQQIQRSAWDGIPLRVHRSTSRLLELFSQSGVKGTFFVLGWVAERCPGLIKSIAERGHEIACHGYSHELIYRQTEAEFREETVRAKSVLEDLCQRPVLGYRAASYSITKESLWALDVLAELGFTYDSSIFPIRHDRYGIPGSPRWPYRLTAPKGGALLEFPPATLSVFGYRLPVGGGGYFRLYPYSVTRFALARLNQVECRPFMFYVHPWEIDAGQPKIQSGRLSKFRHYNNLERCEGRLRLLLQDFAFTTVQEVLAGEGRPVRVGSESGGSR